MCLAAVLLRETMISTGHLSRRDGPVHTNAYTDSKNCLTSRRKCKYLATGEPIQDRRLQGKGLLPGQQAPWLARNDIDISSGQLARDSALDPFDVLPISMPYKSKHLLQYCVSYPCSILNVHCVRRRVLLLTAIRLVYHFGTSNRMNLKGFQAFDWSVPPVDPIYGPSRRLLTSLAVFP